MKRLTVVLAAALIIMAASGTAYAAPDESSSEKSSQSSSASSESSKTSSESKDKTKNTSTELKDKDFATYNIKYFKVLDLSIALPKKDTYILTPEMDPNDPALKAIGKTSSELAESFVESDTIIKAVAEDLSYDITVTISHNDKTKEIGDLTTIDGKELQKISDNLLSSEYAKGCSKNKYNDNVFLTIDLEYDSKSGSKTKIYGIQQYTVINGASVTITMQSYNSKLTDQHKAIMNKVMNSLEFKGINRNGVSDVNNQSIGELNKRHLYLGLASLVAAAALAGIIIVGIKRRQTINAELAEKEAQSMNNSPSNTKVISGSQTEKPAETNKSEPEDLYSNSSQEKASASQKLTSTTELSIPKNPYTPVGKAEAVEQPAMSVTSEIAKFSIINAEAKRRADEEKRREQEDEGIVFAQSSKPKTEIDQIGESVFEDNTSIETDDIPATQPVEDINSLTVAAVDALPESEFTLAEDKPESKPVSAYERKFGKYRNTSFGTGTDRWSDEKEDQVSETDKEEAAPKKVSRFEQRFGKADPVSVSAENADSAEIKAAPVFDEITAEPDTTSEAEPEISEDDSIVNTPNNEKGFDVSTLFGELETEDEAVSESPASQELSASEAYGEILPEEPAKEPAAEEISASEAYGEILPEETPEVPAQEENDPFSMIVEEEDSKTTTGELIRSEEKKEVTEEVREEPAPKNLADEIEDYLPDETQEPEETISPEKISPAPETEEKPVIQETPVPSQPEEKTPAEAAEKTGSPAPAEPAPKEKPKKLSFFEKFKNRIFNAGEDDSIYITPEEIETHTPNEESTGKFLSTVKEKLRNKNVEAPEEETESISETPEVIINTSEKTEEEKPENIKEIYKAPQEETGKIELAIQKNADGKIVINSVSDETGKQLKIDVKDGDAQIKAKAEKARAMTEHLEPAETVNSTELYRADKNENDSSAAEAKPEKAATAVTEAKPEEAEAAVTETKTEEAEAAVTETKTEEAPKSGTAATEQHPRKNKKGRKNKKKNKNKNTVSVPQPVISPETAAGVVAADAAEAVTGIIAGTAAISAAEAVGETKTEAPAETTEETKTEATAETAEETKPEAPAETAEETKAEAPAETAEETKTEATAETAEETKTEATAETAEETKAEATAETAEETKAEATAETTEETKTEATAETAEETKTEAPAETAEETKAEATAETAEETKADATAETAEETKAEAPAETAEETKAEAPAETAEETKSEAPAETAEETKADAPAETAEETKTEAPAETAEETKSEATAETAEETKSEAPAETAEETKAEAPAETAEETKTEAPAETVEETKAEATAETAEETKTETPAETGEEILDTPMQAAFEAKEEIVETAFNFERDSGIRFERADSSPTPVARRTTIFTNIPRLESVNADEYNRTIEQLRRTSSVKEAPAARKPAPETSFRASQPAQMPSAPKPQQKPKPQPPVKTPAKPPVKKKPEPKQESKIEFYSEEGEDDTLDPFAPNSQMGEIPLSELDKKEPAKFSEKLKRSFGKIFTKAEDED